LLTSKAIAVTADEVRYFLVLFHCDNLRLGAQQPNLYWITRPRANVPALLKPSWARAAGVSNQQQPNFSRLLVIPGKRSNNCRECRV